LTAARTRNTPTEWTKIAKAGQKLRKDKPELPVLCRKIVRQGIDDDLISWVERAFDRSFERPSTEERRTIELLGGLLGRLLFG
jgi:hypothetical protein